MKIAITGEKGFLGYHLTQYYIKKNVEVVKLGRNFLENLKLVHDCDFIIHAAGITKSNIEEDVFIKNVDLCNDMVEKLKNLNISINVKFISSIHQNLNIPYGRSKILCNKILKEYCTSVNKNLETYILPNLFGTHGKPYYASFVNTFAYNIIKNLECNFNDNKIALCWVYDAIDVIDNVKTTYDVYNTTPSEVYFLLKGINEYTIDASLSCFASRLETILNYYKNENINIGT